MPEYIHHVGEDGTVTNPTVGRDKFRKLKPGSYSVVIRNLKKRSNKQNSYYWRCVVPLVREGLNSIGYNDVETDEDAHSILKHIFLPKKYRNDLNGDEISIEGSTTDLEPAEFNIYLEKIWQWSSEYLNVVIPAPNQQAQIDYSNNS